MKDALGDRMKAFYEDRQRSKLPRRSYVALRIDGKAFHTYTKGLEKPFDRDLVMDMIATTEYLCANIQGAKLGYVQSDEISIILTDFDTLQTDAWFDYNVQKMVSISASMATAKFNELRPGKIALFDSRVFTLPNFTETKNYLIWRQQDAVRNSKSMLAQSVFSHKELQKKSTSEMEDMLYKAGHVWADLPDSYKNGTLVRKVSYMKGNTERTKWEGDLNTGVFSRCADVDRILPNRDEFLLEGVAHKGTKGWGDAVVAAK